MTSQESTDPDPGEVRRLREMENRLRREYGQPRHFNPADSLDDLIFLLLSRMTQEVKYVRTYARLRDFLLTEAPSDRVIVDMDCDSLNIPDGESPFVEGGHSHTTCVVYGKRSATGTELEAACTLTTPAGDELYAVSKRSAGDVAEGGGGAGELMLVGGTGNNSGVTGTCTYEVDYLANNRYVSRAECAWQR